MRVLSILAIGCLLTCLSSAHVVGAAFCKKNAIKKDCVSAPREPAKPPTTKCTVPGKWACKDSGDGQEDLTINPDLTGLSTSDYGCSVAVQIFSWMIKDNVQVPAELAARFSEASTAAPMDECVGQSRSQNTFSDDCNSFSGRWQNDSGGEGNWSCQRVQ